MDTWPPKAKGPMWKPSRTATKVAKHRDRMKTQKEERDHKGEVRKRDRFCRFPLCGCRKLGLALEARPEVSHHQHKGMGGNPAGDRSVPELMVYLCKHRHQDGAISRHKGTLRPRFLSRQKFNGPIAWEIDASVLARRYDPLRAQQWITVAKETKVQEWTFTERGREVLERLAEMEL